MNLKLLVFVFVLGFTLGFLVLTDVDEPAPLTSACFVENHPCECNDSECVCGNLIVDSSICIQSPK